MVKDLEWEVQYFVEGRLNRRRDYPNKYFGIEFDKEHPQIVNADFRFELNEQGQIDLQYSLKN